MGDVADGAVGQRGGGSSVEGDRTGPGAAQAGLAVGAERQDLPVRVQPRTWVFPLPQYVRRLPGPPSTGATCTSGAPSRVEVQATVVPSGEMRGIVTGTLSALARQARPPSSGASHTSSSAVKATNSPCRCGNRK
ncbi:hypothetical protein SHIRM173S_11454 [Streptomyces hirsutus]